MPKITVSKEKDFKDPYSLTFEEREKDLALQKEAEERALKAEKNSPYKRFVQLNLDMSEALVWLGMNHPQSHAIFLFLLNEMDNSNAVVCSHSVLMEYFGKSKSTIIRAVKLLKEKNFVHVYKVGTANVYTINDKIAWKSYGKNLKYSKFPANVILSFSEQEKESMKNMPKIESDKLKELTIKGG